MRWGMLVGGVFWTVFGLERVCWKACTLWMERTEHKTLVKQVKGRCTGTESWGSCTHNAEPLSPSLPTTKGKCGLGNSKPLILDFCV